MRSLWLVAAVLCLAAGSANATTFILDDVKFVGGQTATGFISGVSLNTCCGETILTPPYPDFSIALSGFPNLTFDNTDVSSYLIAANGYDSLVLYFFLASSDYVLQLAIPGSPAADAMDDPLIPGDDNCGTYSGLYADCTGANIHDYIISGSLDPVPEPSSLWLMSAALCGAFFLRRRRYQPRLPFRCHG